MKYYSQWDDRNPFPRPWMKNNCAASGGGGGGFSLKGLLVGGFTGGIESFFSYPAEFIKTKLQLDEKGQTKQYSGFFDVIKKTVHEKGFLAMYRGLGVILFFSIPKVGIRFGAFETLKNLTIDETGNLGPLNRIVCGLGAGVSEAVFAVTPMETIKVKLIHDQKKPVPEFKGLFDGISKMIKSDGLGGIYQGVLPTIIRQGSNQAIRFYVVESLKQAYRGGDPNVPIPTPVIGLFGLCAGAASVFGNTPVDVIKTRLQGLEAKKYNGVLDCTMQIYKTESLAAFYKGTQARLLRVSLDVTFTFMFYEKIMSLIKTIWP